jgi:two-component system, cell cycle sensor histidine kinase and response regulator CckA
MSLNKQEKKILVGSEENKTREELQREVQELQGKNATATQYIRQKVNQLLKVMGTAPLRPEELDDVTLIELDPISIISDSFAQVLTHLNETSDKLKVAHDEITAIFDSAGMGILVIDCNMRVLALNKKIKSQFQIGQTLTAGMPCRQLICHKDQHEDCPASNVIKNGRSSHMDMVVNERYFNVVATPIKDKGGVISQIVMVYMDMTERVLAHKMLQKSEERYRDLFEHSTDLIHVLGADSSIKYVNHAWLETLGYQEHELSGMSIFDIIDPACQDCGPEFKSVVCGFIDGRFETSFITKEKKRIVVEGDVSAITEDGKFVGTRGIFRDITARKQADEALRRSGEMMRNVLDSVDEGFIVLDRDFRILSANKAYCNQLGRSCNEVIGEKCFSVSHELKIPCCEKGEDCAAKKVFETCEPCTSYHNHIDRAGKSLSVEARAFPLKDESGSVISVILSITNITEKRLLEEERLKTQKLEAIGTLAGGIAHDFNNLLQGVFGYISLARMTVNKREKSLAALQQAEQALHLSVKLTNQLLTFSKGGKPVKKPVDLRPVIDNAVKFALSGSPSVHRMVIEESLQQVEADEGQIGQVIQNIVLNADQAMPEGGLVEITARNVQAPDKNLPQSLQKGGYVEITVRDGGIGIQEHYIAKIFDPYFTTKVRGSGLGLATSYSIIKNHNGVIDVKSVVGKGSTFSIYLPQTLILEKEPQVEPEHSGGTAGKILVMDDDPVILDVAGELIKALGHEAEFAAHGEEAIEKYTLAKQLGKPFNVVILDLTIRGGIGGAETVRRLKEIDPGMKAVVSSGYSDDAITSNYRVHKFDAYLKKPYNVDRLRDVLGRLMNST